MNCTVTETRIEKYPEHRNGIAMNKKYADEAGQTEAKPTVSKSQPATSRHAEEQSIPSKELSDDQLDGVVGGYYNCIPAVARVTDAIN